MPGDFANLLSTEIRKRLSVIATAGAVTFRPSTAADRLGLSPDSDLKPAFNYFLACVAIVLVVEAGFSFVFNTAFSDLVHHFYPVFVALLGVITIYLFLLLLLTPGLTFAGTAAATLYVGGTALLVMIMSIFVLLTADFAHNYQSVMSSSCEHRTIMCLLSGNSTSEYGIMQPDRTVESQGWSFSFVLLLIMAAVIHYTNALTKILNTGLSIARWRTYIAALLSLVVLTPGCLFLINAIYALIYK